MQYLRLSRLLSPQSLSYRLQSVQEIMTSAPSSKDHLQVTKDESRNETIHTCTINSITDLSPTVKELELSVKPSRDGMPFRFLPGQWVDMFIPGIDTVGGFSMTSSPKASLRSSKFTLAIKYSTWPPAKWVHQKCAVGSTVKVRSGGDFILGESPEGEYVFVAGGVGLNPIMSMISHLHDINYTSRITLMFSAKTVDELIFKDRIESIASKMTDFKTQYFVTASESNSPNIHARRMTQGDIAAALSQSSRLYVCGPPSLIELCETLKKPNAYNETDEIYTHAYTFGTGIQNRRQCFHKYSSKMSSCISRTEASLIIARLTDVASFFYKFGCIEAVCDALSSSIFQLRNWAHERDP